MVKLKDDRKSDLRQANPGQTDLKPAPDLDLRLAATPDRPVYNMAASRASLLGETRLSTNISLDQATFGPRGSFAPAQQEPVSLGAYQQYRLVQFEQTVDHALAVLAKVEQQGQGLAESVRLGLSNFRNALGDLQLYKVDSALAGLQRGWNHATDVERGRFASVAGVPATRLAQLLKQSCEHMLHFLLDFYNDPGTTAGESRHLREAATCLLETAELVASH